MGRVNARRGAASRWVVVAIAIIAALAIAAPIAWNNGIRERLFPKRWGVVEDASLYRSGQLHPVLVERTLRDNGIDVIVDLTGPEPDSAAQRAEEVAAAKLGIVHARYPLIGDGTGDIEQYAQAIAAMHRAAGAGQQALVHCSAGTYRTGGVVFMYRVLVEQRPVREAYEELQRYGWKSSDPKLPQYLDEHMGELAARLVELGVIERVPEELPRVGGLGTGD